MEPEPKHSLREIAAHLKKLTRDHELELSTEVMRLADQWELYRNQAGGLEIQKWLQKEVHPTRRLSWYKTRAEAAQRARAASKYFSTRALLWLTRNATNDLEWRRCLNKAREHYREQSCKPLEFTQAQRIFPHLKGKKQDQYTTVAELKEQVRKLGDRILRLENQIRKLGAEPVE